MKNKGIIWIIGVLAVIIVVAIYLVPMLKAEEEGLGVSFYKDGKLVRTVTPASIVGYAGVEVEADEFQFSFTATDTGEIPLDIKYFTGACEWAFEDPNTGKFEFCQNVANLDTILSDRVIFAWGCTRSSDQPFKGTLQAGETLTFYSQKISVDRFSECQDQPIWFGLTVVGENINIDPAKYPLVSDYIALTFREQKVSLDGSLDVGLS